MGKVKQIISATLLSILALSTPCVTLAADLNQLSATAYSPPGGGIGDSTVAAPLSYPEQGADSSGLSHSARWTVSAETLILDRTGTADRTLVELVPGTVAFNQVVNEPSTQVLNSKDLDQGFSPGFRLGATYKVDSDYSLELSFFRVDGWDSTQSIGTGNPLNWLVMKAPGGFFQTQDFPYQSMIWDYTTDLYSAEFNVRHKLSERITLLGGFRWLQLNENLQGSLGPPDQYLPNWKYTPGDNLYDVQQIEYQGTPATGAFPPFWNTSTTNNLYGLQIGVDGKLFERGPFSIDTLIKAGGYLNRASESTTVSIQKVLFQSGGSENHAAFVGEVGLQCKYLFASGLALKLGYEAVWLEGVALAPGQIQETYIGGLASVTSLGINSGSGVLFHGVTAGLEYSF